MPTKIYNEQTDFSFDTNNFEWDSGLKLKLQDVSGQDFTEDFVDDTGFTYDSDLVEFSGGQIQQKDLQPSDSQSWITYESTINLNYGAGTLTGTATGGASISGNKLDLAQSDVRYVTYNATNNITAIQTGTVKLKYTPNYSGSPGGDRSIMYYAGTSNNNLLFIRHRGSGQIQILIYDSTGSSIITTDLGAWSPSSGTTYEIELNYDITIGATRLFIDGTQLGSTQIDTGIRDSDITQLRVGSNVAGTDSSNFYIEDLIFFDTVQHTTNYTPGYTLYENKYVASDVILPEMEFTGDGTLVSFDTFTTTENNSPRYTLQIGRSGNYLYWDGAAWSISDGTYAQATNATTFNINCGDLSVNGEVYGQFKVHFDNSNTIQMSVDELTASLTAQLYPTSNLSTTTNPILSTQGYTSLAIVSTENVNDYLKHTIEIDGQEKYWDSVSWVNSTGYTQSNTTTELIANISSLDLSVGVEAYIKTYHHSNNGTGRPALTSITAVYDFYAGTIDDPDETVVYGFCKDKNGTALSGVQIYAELTNSNAIYDEDIMLFNYPDLSSPIATTNANGYWDYSFIETENQDGTKWLITFVYNNKSKTYEVDVPHPDNTDDGISVDFADLVMTFQL